MYTCVHAMQEVFDLMRQNDHEKVSRTLLAVVTGERYAVLKQRRGGVSA
jgi:hypothetical protein